MHPAAGRPGAPGPCPQVPRSIHPVRAASRATDPAAGTSRSLAPSNAVPGSAAPIRLGHPPVPIDVLNPRGANMRNAHTTTGAEPRRTARTPMLLGTLVAATAGLAGCGGGGGANANDTVVSVPQDPALVAKGKEIFRFETFGDEAKWTDQLHMHKVIEAVDPLTAASVGLKIDAEALPAEVVRGIKDGSIKLDDPQTTLALLKLNAVVGAKGEVVANAEGRLELKRFGITCALCHSTVSKDLHVLAGGTTDLAGIVGRRLDGWPNRDLNPGAIIALSPMLDQKTKDLLNQWGPGKYDARWNFDGKSNPTVIRS